MLRGTVIASAMSLASLWPFWAFVSHANAQSNRDISAASVATPSLDAAQVGRRLYTQNCSHCHGFNMVNPGTVSYDLRKFPLEDPDRFFSSVREGKGAMPSWKASLTSEQITQIWAYVQTRGKL